MAGSMTMMNCKASCRNSDSRVCPCSAPVMAIRLTLAPLHSSALNQCGGLPGGAAAWTLRLGLLSMTQPNRRRRPFGLPCFMFKMAGAIAISQLTQCWENAWSGVLSCRTIARTHLIRAISSSGFPRSARAGKKVRPLSGLCASLLVDWTVTVISGGTKLTILSSSKMKMENSTLGGMWRSAALRYVKHLVSIQL